MPNFIKNRTWIDINLSKIPKNLKTIRKFIGDTGIIFVAKSDCMGFGLVPVVKKAVAAGVDKVAVSELSEAIALRQAGVTQPILLLYQPINWEINALIDNNIDISISNPSVVPTLMKAACEKEKMVSVDLFLETGMHRYGLQKKDIEKTINDLKSCPYIKITSISSHFATSDTDLDFAKKQLTRFLERMEMVCNYCDTIESIHISNSAATKLILESWDGATYKHLIPNARVYVRVCRALMGATNVPLDSSLLPVFERVTSHVAEVQTIKKGEYVGYDKSFQAEKDMTIATVPVGWANCGYYFRKATVVVNGKKCKMIGTPSANAMTIDDCGDVKVGDLVYLIKQDGEGEQMTLEDLAQMNGITHTHITASLGGFIPRVYSE